MSLIAQNATPAERFLGCTFAENFETPQAVVVNGGVVTGAPVIAQGATFDWASDYITYPKPFDLSKGGSVYIRFKTSNASQLGYLFSSTISSSNKFGLVIASNTLIFRYLDAARSVSTTSSLQNNVVYDLLVIYNGSTRPVMYLNGVVQSGTSGVTLNDTVSMKLGANPAGATLYEGQIFSVKFFSRQLDAQDAIAYSTNRLYDYRNRAVLDLPMTMDTHDPTNTRTLDVSGKGNHAVLQNAPTKTDRHGYSLNGTTQRMRIGLDSSFDVSEVTMALGFIPNFSPSNANEFYILESSSLNKIIKKNAAASHVLSIGVGDSTVASIPLATYSPYWKTGGFNSLIIVAKPSYVDIHLNGILIYNSTVSWYPAILSFFYLGVDFLISTFYDGAFTSFQYFPFYLSSLQVADLHLRMMQGVKDV